MGERYPEDLVTEEICQLEKMGHKDWTPQQIPDRKGVQSLKGNHPGKWLRIPDQAGETPPNKLLETNKNFPQCILPYTFTFVYAFNIIFTNL